MKSNVYQAGNMQVLAIQEALTHTECEELKDLIGRATATGTGRVSIDLSEVPFVDSAILELLLTAAKDCVSHGGRLKLVAPSANCMEILRLTDLKSRFEIVDSIEEATRRVL